MNNSGVTAFGGPSGLRMGKSGVSKLQKKIDDLDRQNSSTIGDLSNPQASMRDKLDQLITQLDFEKVRQDALMQDQQDSKVSTFEQMHDAMRKKFDEELKDNQQSYAINMDLLKSKEDQYLQQIQDMTTTIDQYEQENQSLNSQLEKLL